MEPIVEEIENITTSDSSAAIQDTKTEERLLDAQAIEELSTNLDRPSARAYLDALVKRLRSNSVTSSTEPKAVTRPVAKSSPTRPPPVSMSVKYIPINKFALELGGYNSPVVTLYLDIPSVGSVSKENISCHFTKSSLDLIGRDLNGKNYRLLKY